METPCGAIGSPWDLPFADMTYAGYKYIGCGTDAEDGSRTLTGDSYTDVSEMTIEWCVKDFCEPRGFTYAGLEYSTQCYCGDSLPTDRAPVSDIMGQCSMPCSGNSSEVCGGSGLISLYEKCNSSSPCVNSIPFYNNGTSTFSSGVSTIPPTSSASPTAPIYPTTNPTGTPSASIASSSGTSTHSTSKTSLMISSTVSAPSSYKTVSKTSSKPSPTPASYPGSSTSTTLTASISIPSHGYLTPSISSKSHTATYCYQDNCLRAFERFSTSAEPFCASFTAAAIPVTATPSLPAYATVCTGATVDVIARISSACSCLAAQTHGYGA